MNGGLSARGMRRAYERGRKWVRHLNRQQVDQMKRNIEKRLAGESPAATGESNRKNWSGSR